jgi:putative nucleotidyltransferase with HDIG domain
LSSVSFADATGKLLKRRAVMFDMSESRQREARQLAIAIGELDFEHTEKDKRAAELVIANQELLFQNDEKAKRAAELVIANQELLFQNEEKDKRAAELATANEEILLQLKEIEGAFWRIVEVATLLTEMRDPYTSGHERRVAEIAVAIGAELGLDARQQEGLRVAGCLHDIGKINVPSEILAKPGKLKPAEYALIKSHPQDGYEVLKNVNFPWKIAEIVLQHHERHDGTGYPQGLRGEDILFEARVIATADVVEAMSSHRPYRAALGIGAALTEIERGRGTKFDPTIADACLRLFRERGYSIPV